MNMIDIKSLILAKKGQQSLRDFAAAIKCSAPYISDILHDRRAPGPKVLKALGLEKHTETIVTYKRKRL